MAVCIKRNYSNQVNKVDALRAEESQEEGQLVLYDRHDKVIGRVRLSDIESWWTESEAA
jgi:predicted N-acetyltransferase YhbS